MEAPEMDFITGRMFVFDMDGTLLPNTTACLEIARVSDTVAALTDLERRFGEELINAKQFASELHVLWSGLDRELVREAFRQSPKLENIQRVMELIAAHGGTSCLITMSPDFFAERFYDYGVDVIKASRFPASADGSLELEKILDPADKPILVEQLCRAGGLNPLDAVAFGDSGSDIPLFRKLRHTIAVNAAPTLRSIAAASYDGNDLLEAFELVPGIIRPSAPAASA